MVYSKSLIEGWQGIEYEKRRYSMPDSYEYDEQEDKTMGKNIQERELMIQIAKILLNEKLLNPEEQIRFLNILNEEG